jgi:PEP-CTERM motif-containing protein
VNGQLDNTKSFSLAISCCALILAGAALYRGIKQYNRGPLEERNSVAFSAAGFKGNAPFGHPYFRYSVIPGGAHSPEDLRRALRNDDVVRTHYADFKADSARVVVLDRDRLAFVSYRVGDQVFWTRKPVHLRKGETLLSDGTHLARTRCGNRISDDPPKPNAAAEPEESALSAPVLIATSAPPPTPSALDLAPEMPVNLAPVSGAPKLFAPLASNVLPVSFPLSDFLPADPEVSLQGVLRDKRPAVIMSAPYAGLDQIRNAAPPPSMVSEPGSLLLALFGGGGVAFARRRRLKRRISGAGSAA